MAFKKLNRGLFITIEGPEGSGKTTQSRLLYSYLGLFYPAVFVREPGATKAGEAIRAILLHKKDTPLSVYTELFLFEAARAQVVDEVIRPSLDRKKIVVCDRFSDATFVYQGYAGRVPLDEIDRVDRIARQGVMPDLTIILDIDAKTGLVRASRKGRDRFECKGLKFHRKVRRGYLELAGRFPGRIKVVKVDGGIERVQDRIRHVALALVRRAHGNGPKT